jgi:putative transposase
MHSFDCLNRRRLKKNGAMRADTLILTYLGLLRQNLEDTNVRILAYYLMSDHVHLIAVPGRPDSMSVLMRRVHGPYAQYYNVRAGRTGHLWQNRFFGCMLAASHLWSAVTYVERNPLRARIVRRAEDYVWSSATAHATGGDGSGLLDRIGGGIGGGKPHRKIGAKY